MPTLAELRAQTGPKPLPRAKRTVTLVEGQHLLARSQELHEQLIDVLEQIEREKEAAKDDGRDRTRKAGEKPEPEDEDPRVVKIRDETRAVVEQLSGFQSEIDLNGLTGGEWQRYKDAHPPREDNKADHRYASGLCNSTDVFNDLGQFVVAWEGEALADGDWNGWLAERICYADRRDLIAAVVDMHENKLPRAPFGPSSASPTESSATD